jgi:hypothetical protein
MKVKLLDPDPPKIFLLSTIRLSTVPSVFQTVSRPSADMPATRDPSGENFTCSLPAIFSANFVCFHVLGESLHIMIIFIKRACRKKTLLRDQLRRTGNNVKKQSKHTLLFHFANFLFLFLL